MKRYKGVDIFFLTGSAIFAAVLIFILFSFINGLTSSSYLLLLNEGSTLRKITSRYQYNNSLRGVILTTSFIIASLSLFLMVLYSMAEPRSKRKADPVEKVNHLTEEQTETEETEGEDNAATDEGGLKLDTIPRKQPAQSEPSVASQQKGATTIADAAPNNVIYGHGEIDNAGMKEFVMTFPDTAIKFAFQTNINGTPLPDGTKDLHRKWSERGLNRIDVKKEIQNVLKWEVLDGNQLREMSVELKRKIDEIKQTAG